MSTFLAGYSSYSSYPYASTYGSGYSSSSADAGILAAMAMFWSMYYIVVLAVAIISIISMWKIFVKAGEEGWKAIIPFYNMYTLCKISGTPTWVFILACIPCLWFFSLLLFNIFTAVKLTKSFGKDGGFAVGLILLSSIFYPILAFGKSEYVGPAE